MVLRFFLVHALVRPLKQLLDRGFAQLCRAVIAYGDAHFQLLLLLAEAFERGSDLLLRNVDPKGGEFVAADAEALSAAAPAEGGIYSIKVSAFYGIIVSYYFQIKRFNLKGACCARWFCAKGAKHVSCEI